ncbi:Non-specific serine/threonine protein kinase protein [Dioscorea alata]|uniref:Non-specific serine/threonine protein kinase protein n=2 Tax=Dioscorea alata TaxID=55571 RepID=A0ACB7U7J0_DIOAL|nr:Non-specific serine/threonine protein kinase protein [Dioscorea alata]KAH7656275.1 Non-specific serine/threonine protein kinase protein [Dioscorea alata]
MITQGVDAVLTIVRGIRSRWRCHDRQHVEEDSKVHLGLFKRFTLQELQVATDNFRETNIVGIGSLGKVYRGKLADDSLVTIARLDRPTSYGRGVFQAVVDLIDYICFHRNILRVIGFCMTSKEQLLVYPFMANGTLDTWLRGSSASKPPLNWPTRMQIALGAARGLSFLHERCVPKIIHAEVTPSNIFLDEEFEAVLGNFYLATQMGYKDDDITETVRGTIGFIAPEFVRSGELSEKCDVYGYGMTLLELITGQNSQFNVEQLLKEKMLDSIADPKLKNNYVKEEVESLIQIALLCIQDEPDHRPKMSEVVRMIQGNGPAERWVEQELDVEMALYRTFHTASD